MSRRIAPALALALGLLAAGTAPAVPLDTPFTYQGRLEVGGVPATGNYDFEFRLFDAATGGNQVGGTATRPGLAVNDGLFSTPIDFNNVFDGNRLYLEIAVRPAGSGGAYTTLTGRVQIFAVPYAQYSINADKVDGLHASSFSLSSHTHQLSDLPGAVTDSQVPNNITISFAGNSDKVDGLDASAFATADHRHTHLYGPPGGVFQNDAIIGVTVAGSIEVDGVIQARSDEAPGALRLFAGHSPSDTEPTGGNVEIKGGRGVDSTPGGAGGDVMIDGGLADGTGANPGGNVILKGGQGTNGGGFGTVFIDGLSEAEDLKIFRLRDSTEAYGIGGQVLTATGTDVEWADVVVSSLAASDGDPAHALEANEDGALVFPNGQTITSFTSQLRVEQNGSVLRVNTTSDTDLGILGGSSTVGGGVFRVEATSPTGASSSGTALTLKAGGAFQNGGNASLTAGDGGQGNGGTLALAAGSVTSVGAAGTGGAVTIAAGNAYQGGGGDVTIEAGDSLFATGAATPGGDVFLNPGVGVSGGANGKVYANGALVANNANGVSITLDPSTAANPQVTFAAGTGASGKLTIAAPDAPLSNTDGRDIELIAGDGVIAGVGNGGDVVVRAGNGAGLSGGVGGDGGSVTITAGNGDSDSNAQDGGNINLNAGLAQGGGTAGIVATNARVGVLRTSASHPIHVGTGASNGNGAHVTNGGVWTNGSDKNSKTAFEEVDSQAILDKVLALPVTRWQYQGEPEGVRHIGPMAQDFMAAFGLGESERHIGTVDADGVALAAIKGLHEETDDRLKALEAENAELRARLAAMEEAIARMATTEGVAR